MPTRTMRAGDLSRSAYCRDIFSPNLAFSAAGNFSPLWNTTLSESSSAKSVQGSRTLLSHLSLSSSTFHSASTKRVYAESLALGSEMRVRRGPREKWMKNIVLDTMAPNPWRDIPGIVADTLHDAEGKIGY